MLAWEIPKHGWFSLAYRSMARGVFEKMSPAIWRYEAKRLSDMCGQCVSATHFQDDCYYGGLGQAILYTKLSEEMRQW